MDSDPKRLRSGEVDETEPSPPRTLSPSAGQDPESMAAADPDYLFAFLGEGWTTQKVKVNEWQLYSPRLAQILALEREDAPLSSDLVQEKNSLFAEGFPTWSRSDFQAFLKICVERGRDIHASNLVGQIPDKSAEEVSQYLSAFWSRGSACFSVDNWKSIMSLCSIVPSKAQMNRELLQKEVKRKLAGLAGSSLAGGKISDFFPKGTSISNDFCFEEDRFLLKCFAENKSTEEIKQSIYTSPEFDFDHYLRSRTVPELSTRLDSLVELIKKEMDDQAKAVHKAQKDKEKREMEEAALQKKEQELIAKLEELEKSILTGTYEPSSASIGHASSPRAFGGTDAQETASPHSANEDDDSDPGEPTLEPKLRELVLKTVLSSGSCGMAQLLDKVVRILPDGLISKRQLKREISLLAVKEKRVGDRAAKWYVKDAAS